MTAENANLGDRALNKVVEIGITSQVDLVESIEVDLRSNPIDLIQGKVESIEISSKGMVVRQDLRIETLEIGTDRVSINPVSAIFGNVELTHPTEAEARITLVEADINRAFSCAYVQDKMQGLQMEMDGQPVTIDVRSATLDLPGENKFVITTDFAIRESGEIKKMSATAIPQIDENGNRISLEILAAEGQGLTLKLVLVIFEQLAALLDLRNFNLPGVSLQLHQLEAQSGKLVIHAKSQISQIPMMPS